MRTLFRYLVVCFSLMLASRADVINQVAIGQDSSPIDYSWEYETVGVSSVGANLRLQSPNSVIVHTGASLLESFIVTNNGYVGIGTTSPSDPLAIGSPASGSLVLGQYGNGAYIGTRFAPVGADVLRLGTSYTEHMRIDQSGYIGIGTTSPQAKLTVAAGDVALDQGRAIRIGDWAVLAADAATAYIRGRNVAFQDSAALSTPLFIKEGGNVGIGITNPSHKLTVNGTIRAKEVIVDTGWADYVFAEDYRLAPLSEVEAHIKAHKHLPDMPSAAEVGEKGVSMGEMQAKMMAKIEELTLHVIAQEKRAMEQEKRAAEQERRIQTQQEEIATLRSELTRNSSKD